MKCSKFHFITRFSLPLISYIMVTKLQVQAALLLLLANVIDSFQNAITFGLNKIITSSSAPITHPNNKCLCNSCTGTSSSLSSARSSLDKILLASQALRNLETTYQISSSIDECELETISSCGSSCEACGGSGVKLCRFCQGTKQLSFGKFDGVQDCVVCVGQGVETCKDCQGAGLVGNWKTAAAVRV